MDATVSHGWLSQADRDPIACRHKLLIGGRWVNADSGETVAVFDPCGGQQIAQAAECAAQDVDLAVQAARRALKDGSWARMRPTKRQRWATRLSSFTPRPRPSQHRCGRWSLDGSRATTEARL